MPLPKKLLATKEDVPNTIEKAKEKAITRGSFAAKVVQIMARDYRPALLQEPLKAISAAINDAKVLSEKEARDFTEYVAANGTICEALLSQALNDIEDIETSENNVKQTKRIGGFFDDDDDEEND